MNTGTFEATVFVCSVQGFTKRSNEMTPADLAAWTNGFLRRITDAVVRERGAPVKYIGDALPAYFAEPGHEERALRAAKAARHGAGEPLVIGLASGPIFLAEIGHPEWARPDILGATVNAAFRVLDWAGSNTTGGIAIAGTLPHALAARVERKRHAAVQLKGFPNPIDITEVV